MPIPAFYDASGEPILNADIVRQAAALIAQHGSNVWFATPAAELWTQCRPATWSGPEAVAKGHDTLDVWIDSGSSSRAVLAARSELQHPGRTGADAWRADVYLEGSDQHRGWFQSSLLLSLAGNGAAPFHTVLTHGFMVDEDREKISKSKQGEGGYQKPQTADRYIKEYGADVLRLWVASQDYRSDIVVSEERLKKVGETYRLIRNTLRYQLSNLFDFDPARDAVADADLTGLDRWILGEFAALEADVDAAYRNFEFHVVYQKISQFVAVQLSATYHDVVKDRLYTDPVNSARRRSTQTALHRMVTRLCQMLSPMLVFTAEEAWEFIPGRPAGSVHASEWTPASVAISDAERAQWAARLQLREDMLKPLEKARQEKTIGKALDAQVTLCATAAYRATVDPEGASTALLQELANVSQLHWETTETPTVEVVVAKAAGVKCDRCWHWETDVGADAAFPELCPRCVKAVTTAAPPVA